jgi:hypothetical protein
MPITKLRIYLDAYGIKPKSMLEKDDLIEAIIDARVGRSRVYRFLRIDDPQSLNGGLSSDHEVHKLISLYVILISGEALLSKANYSKSCTAR